MPRPNVEGLTSSQLLIHFETNNVIDMGQLSLVFFEIARLAAADPGIGPEAQIILRTVMSGSPTTAIIEILNAAGAAAGIGDFGIGLANLIMENRQRKVSRRVGELMFDNDVSEFMIAVRDPDGDGIRRITMDRQRIPAAIDAEKLASRIYGKGPYGRGNFSKRIPRTSRSEALEWAQNDALEWADEEDLEWDDEPLSLADEEGSQIGTEHGMPGGIENDGSSDQKTIELLGRVVTTHQGRFAIFRTGNSEYRIVRPLDLYQSVPIGEDLHVVGHFDEDGGLVISGWSMADAEDFPQNAIEKLLTQSSPERGQTETSPNETAQALINEPGEFLQEGNSTIFVRDDGRRVRVVGNRSGLPLPIRMPVLVTANSARAPKGRHDARVVVSSVRLIRVGLDRDEMRRSPQAATVGEMSSEDRIVTILSYGERQIPVAISSEFLEDLEQEVIRDKASLLEVTQHNFSTIAELAERKIEAGDYVGGAVVLRSSDLR